MAGAPVLAVLVAHGSGSWLADALASLAAQTHRPFEVVLVAVGDVGVAQDALPRRLLKEVVRVPAGTGFARAVNEGLAAVASDAPYVLLLHDDAAPFPDAIEHLVALAEATPDAAAVGAKLVEWDSPEILQEIGGAIDRLGVRRSGVEVHEVDHGQHDAVSDVLFASSACLLVRRAALDEQRLDPAAWPLYEDVDLCWRLRAGGGRVLVAPEARVRHAAALSRGLRRGAGASFGSVGIRTHTERGRLWFMLKNYRPLTAAALLPQYVILSVLSLVVALVRREFWRVRSQLTAWLRVAAELPHIVEARRRAGPRRLHDAEILGLAARQAAPSRRFARVAVLGRGADALGRLEERFLAAVRDPLTWASVAALIVVLVTLRSVLGSGSFTLGQLRPLPTLTRALSSYLARFRAEGVDPSVPGSAGIVVLGALRSFPFVSGPLAEKIALIGPLLLASLGGLRLGRVLGLGTTGRRWLAIGIAANPATFVLVRTGSVGALIGWSAASWLASSFLSPARAEPGGGSSVPEDFRRRARWALGWAVTAALHPPAVLWLTLLAIAIAVSSSDGRAAARWRQIALGTGGALVLNVPWSLEWFTSRSPLWGRGPGIVPATSGGLDAATFGAGWPLLVWTGIGVLTAFVVRPSRLSLAMAGLLGGAWLAGVRGALPGQTALAVAGWCSVVLIAYAGHGMREELQRFALGWRHVGVLVVGASLGVAWAGSGVEAIADGAPARTVSIVPTARASTGRVLWLIRSQGGTASWVTDGFSQTLGAWPPNTGPGERLLVRSMAAARAKGLHRLGSVLALADVSHVVALDPDSLAGLGGQTDLSVTDVQAGATIYRNHSWAGPALSLASAPDDPLAPATLAALAGSARPLEARQSADGYRLSPPEGGPGGGSVVYVAGGARPGWTIGGVRATPAAAGVWVPTGRVAVSGAIDVQAPGGWRRALFPLQGAAALAVVLIWLAGAYLAGPQTGPAASAEAPPAPLRAPAMLAPAALVAAAIAIGWAAPAGALASGFLSSAWFCPPAGEGIAQRIAIVNAGADPVRYVVRPSVGSAEVGTDTLDPRRRVTLDANGATGAVVETFGGRLHVASIVGGEAGGDSSPCARAPRRVSLFAEGGRNALSENGTVRTGFIVANPFAELARASVRFFTAEETVSPPGLQDVRVEPGRATLIDPESQLEPQQALGAEITVWQGRAVVARRLRRGTTLLSWTLGTTATSGGVLPRASTRGYSTTLVAVNPGDEPARVTTAISGLEGSLPELNFDVDANSRDVFDLSSAAQDSPELVARVSSEPRVAIESVAVGAGNKDPSVFPLLSPARAWVLPVAEGRTVLFLNPGPGAVTIDVQRLGGGYEIAPVRVGAGRYATLAPSDPSVPEPFGLLVTARRGGIVVSMAGPGGASVGIPVDR